MRTLKLYGSGAATANGVATLTLPAATTIKHIQYSVVVDSITDNAIVRLELSRSSATEIAVNGAQQSLIEVGAYGNFVTSGLTQSSIVGAMPCSFPFAQGQLLYLHAVVAGTATYYACFVIHY